MGIQEKESRKRSKRNELRNIVLASVQVAGLMGVALLAPGVIKAMHMAGMLPSTRQHEVIKATTKRLVQNGLLGWYENKLRITDKGKLELLRSTENVRRTTKRKWDKKWRVLIFDIPQYRKGMGDKVRMTLRAVGFTRLQDSVWVYPSDCEDLVVLLNAHLPLPPSLLSLLFSSLSPYFYINKYFGLR